MKKLIILLIILAGLCLPILMASVVVPLFDPYAIHMDGTAAWEADGSGDLMLVAGHFDDLYFVLDANDNIMPSAITQFAPDANGDLVPST